MSVVIIGNEKYTGRFELVGGEGEAVLITLAEHREWDNGQDVVLRGEDIRIFVKALEATLVEENPYQYGDDFDHDIVFGSDKYSGRLSPSYTNDIVAILEVAEWSEWDNGEEAVITREQAAELIELLV